MLENLNSRTAVNSYELLIVLYCCKFSPGLMSAARGNYLPEAPYLRETN